MFLLLVGILVGFWLGFFCHAIFSSGKVEELEREIAWQKIRLKEKERKDEENSKMAK